MRLSPAGLSLIKQFEGFRAEPYQCQAGVWTIGYGTTKINGEPVRRNTPKVTEEKASEYLLADVGFAERGVQRMVDVKLKQNQFDAIVSLVYNIGLGAFKASTLLKRLNAGKYTEAAAQILVWVYADGARSKGLINRRVAEFELFNKK